ncbi:porin [Psychromonas sp. Urea-02u-13]|uniref:porin n=1 Tax=Psychromonas sp. Urea-02u-13 TaxID=2058326 RepID=UPI000C34FD15|nr:porin [Psychromonas sp. Urea-02u-13]PKG40131.1 porin [Psychromonas sp. Urea-02u-13]
MKKTLLATAIVSALVSATAGAATVYDQDGTTLKVGGRAEVRGLFSDSVDGTMEDKSRARINFGGETKISENLTGFGFMEYEIKSGASEVKNRYLFAGIGTKIGDFSYGKQDSANVQVSDFTDIASEHSGQQQYVGAAKDKRDNNFLYSGTFADALTVQTNYIANGVQEFDKDGNAQTASEDAFGISAVYAFDFGLDLGASYSDQDEENQATLGATYTWNDLYVAATYAMGATDANTDFTSLEAAVQYKFTKEFRLMGIVGMAEEDDGATMDTEDFFALEAQYRFNKSIRTFASYKLNNLDEKEVGKADSENELMVGLRYNF